MSFARLYAFVEQRRELPVSIEEVLVPEVIRLSAQDTIEFIPVDLDPEISLGHIKQFRQAKSVYDTDSEWVTSIRWHSGLNMCERRFVCCKELMHVFDSAEARTDTPVKFITLLDELSAPPPSEQASPMYISENRTKWMALTILVPRPLRDWAVQQLNAGHSEYEVALALRIPEVLISTVVGERYDPILDSLLDL